MASQESFDEDDDNEITSGKRKTKKRSVKSNRQPSAHISDGWKTEIITEFISYVEQYPCIWDFGHADYKHRNKRTAAWRAVSTAMGDRFTAEECSLKWQFLRRTFREKMKSAKQTKSGQAATHKPSWIHYESMAFVAASEIAQTTNTESNLDVIDFEFIIPNSFYVLHYFLLMFTDKQLYRR